MKKSIFMLLAAAAFVSCSDNNAVEPNVNAGDAMIQLRSTHETLNAGGVATRAPYVGTISATNPLEARVLSATATGDYSAANLHLNHKMTFVGGTTVSSYDATGVDAELLNFPAEGNIWLFGAYPFTGWGAPTTENKIGFTFDGSHDVMVAGEVATTKADVQANTYASLAFKHLLTKLEVSVVAKTNAAAGYWGKINKIELVKAENAALKNHVDVTLAATPAATFSGTTASLPFYTMSETAGVPSYGADAFTAAEYTLTTTQAPVAYSIVAPFTATGDDATTPDLTFMIYSDKEPLGREVKVGLKDQDKTTAFTGATAGRAFSIVFSFGVNNELIVAGASVTDWVFSGETVKDLE